MEYYLNIVNKRIKLYIVSNRVTDQYSIINTIKIQFHPYLPSSQPTLAVCTTILL